jgi:hypothetical protein
LLDAAIASSETQRESMWRLRESIPQAQRREGASNLKFKNLECYITLGRCFFYA